MRLLAADRVAPWRSPCPDSIDELYRPHPWWPISRLLRRAVSLVHPMSAATAARPVLAGQPDVWKDVHMALHSCSPKMVRPARSEDSSRSSLGPAPGKADRPIPAWPDRPASRLVRCLGAGLGDRGPCSSTAGAPGRGLGGRGLGGCGLGSGTPTL